MATKPMGFTFPMKVKGKKAKPAAKPNPFAKKKG